MPERNMVTTNEKPTPIYIRSLIEKAFFRIKKDVACPQIKNSMSEKKKYITYND